LAHIFMTTLNNDGGTPLASVLPLSALQIFRIVSPFALWLMAKLFGVLFRRPSKD
jgi:hypothetical protein